jgi:hypothetical protein
MFPLSKNFSSHTLEVFLYSVKWTDAPYNSSHTVAGEHVLENDIDESSSDIGARFQECE